MPAQGHKTYMQIGKEVTWGTPVAATDKFEVISSAIVPVIGTIQDPSLHSAVSRRALYQAGRLVRGTFTLRMNYIGMLQLMRGIFGTYSSTLLSVPARDHEFKEASALFSYTIELFTDVPGGKCEQYVGAKFINATWRGTAGQGNDAMVQCGVTVLAKKIVTDITPASLGAFPALYPVLYHQSGAAPNGVVDDGTTETVNARVRSFEVSYEQPHTEDRFYMQALNMDEPLRSDFVTVRWRFTEEFNSKTALDHALAFTVGSPKLVFQHPEIITGAFRREFELRSNKANLVDYSHPIEGYGIVISTLVWEAWFDTVDATALYARLRTNESAI